MEIKIQNNLGTAIGISNGEIEPGQAMILLDNERIWVKMNDDGVLVLSRLEK